MISERLIELIEETGDYEVCKDYSGRNMFGKTCVGFTTERGSELGAVAEIMIMADTDEQEELVEIFKTARTDDMGKHDVIIYFPRMKAE